MPVGAGKATRKGLLPMAAGTRVFLYGLSAEAAKAAGLVVVADVGEADLAIVRAPAPVEE